MRPYIKKIISLEPLGEELGINITQRIMDAAGNQDYLDSLGDAKYLVKDVDELVDKIRKRVEKNTSEKISWGGLTLLAMILNYSAQKYDDSVNYYLLLGSQFLIFIVSIIIWFLLYNKRWDLSLDNADLHLNEYGPNKEDLFLDLGHLESQIILNEQKRRRNLTPNLVKLWETEEEIVMKAQELNERLRKASHVEPQID